MLTNFVVIFLKSVDAVDIEKGAWWVGTGIGCLLAVILNWLRPRYEDGGRFWRPVYRFLLEQMSPPG